MCTAVSSPGTEPEPLGLGGDALFFVFFPISVSVSQSGFSCLWFLGLHLLPAPARAPEHSSASPVRSPSFPIPLSHFSSESGMEVIETSHTKGLLRNIYVFPK